MIIFATALSLSVIFGAGWAAGNGKEKATYESPVTVNAEEPENLPDDKEVLKGSDVDDEDDFHLKMPSPPRFRFRHLVLPGIIHKP